VEGRRGGSCEGGGEGKTPVVVAVVVAVVLGRGVSRRID